MQEVKLRYLRSGATPDVFALALAESGVSDPFGEESATSAPAIIELPGPGRTEFTLQMNRHERRAAAKRARSKR